MTYQYGNGFEKDLESLDKWFKKEHSVDFDPVDLTEEIKKILKYNNSKIIIKEAIGEKIVEEFDSISSFAEWFNKWDETYCIEIKKEKFCTCDHSEECHNQKEGCTDSNEDQGYCVCTEFEETKSYTCDVCNNSFDYLVWKDADVKEEDGTISRPAEELPDGYLIFGKWVCQDCGSCSECGASLEKEGNMLENKDDKLCRDCYEEKEVKYTNVEKWYDDYLEKSDRELLYKELDLKIPPPTHFDDLLAEDQAKVKQALARENIENCSNCKGKGWYLGDTNPEINEYGEIECEVCKGTGVKE